MVDIEEINRIILAKFPLLGAVLSGVKYYARDYYKDVKNDTALTDGKDVYYNESFMASLPLSEQVFIIAHEDLHIAFNHPNRGKDRDSYLWNIAIDAVTNDILSSNGIPTPQGGVDLPFAHNKSAEEVYNILINLAELPQWNHTHQLWEELGDGQEEVGDSDGAGAQLEQNFNEQNAQLKRDKAGQIQNEQEKNYSKFGAVRKFSVNAVQGKGSVDWRKVLKYRFENQQDVWSYRRSCAENYYQAQIGTIEKEHSKIEVMLDTSGSVSEDLLKNFLRSLLPLVGNSELSVGCFSTKFYGFTKVKTKQDIENLSLCGRGGTNFDEAIEHFSEGMVEKIVFTDGEGASDYTDKKLKNLVWLVYKNKNFTPASGRVIFVNSNEFCSSACCLEK